MQCGYDGPAIRASRTTHCVLCGCDLAQRPPRSYAELEGFITMLPAPEPVDVETDTRRVRIRQRWVAFSVCVTCAIATLAYLAWTAFSV